MGQLTTWARQYHAGSISWETLVTRVRGAELATPARLAEIPADVFEADAQAEERSYDEEGTWDELIAAADAGLLTGAELVALAEARTRQPTEIAPETVVDEWHFDDDLQGTFGEQRDRLPVQE